MKCPDLVDPCRLPSPRGEKDPNHIAQESHGVDSQSRVPLEVIANAARRVRIPPSPQNKIRKSNSSRVRRTRQDSNLRCRVGQSDAARVAPTEGSHRAATRLECTKPGRHAFQRAWTRGPEERRRSAAKPSTARNPSLSANQHELSALYEPRPYRVRGLRTSAAERGNSTPARAAWPEGSHRAATRLECTKPGRTPKLRA